MPVMGAGEPAVNVPFWGGVACSDLAPVTPPRSNILVTSRPRPHIFPLIHHHTGGSVPRPEIAAIHPKSLGRVRVTHITTEMSRVSTAEISLSRESYLIPAMVASFGSLLAEKLRKIQGSFAATIGLAGSSSTSELTGPGTVSRAFFLCDGSNPQRSPSPRKQAGPSTSNEGSWGVTYESSDFLLRKQHKATMLASHGVKVRDFAYESTLPPVPSYKPPINAGPRRLKRKRADEEEEEDSEFVRAILAKYTMRRTPDEEVLARSVKRFKPLERAMTEPIEESQSQPAMGMTDIAQIDAGLPESQLIDYFCANLPKTPTQSTVALPRSPFDPIQHPRIHFSTPTHHSIDTTSHPSHPRRGDEWVATPTETPASSFQHPTPSTSAAHVPLMPSTPRRPLTRTVPFTPTFAPIASPRPLRRSFSSHVLLRSTGPTPLSRSPSFRQMPIAKSRGCGNVTPRRLSNGSLTATNEPEIPPPRYFLRQRTRPASPPKLGARGRTSSRNITSTSPRKPRSSYSKNTTKAAGKTKSAPKPNAAPGALRRSTRRRAL